MACASPTRWRWIAAQEAAGQLRFEIEAAFSQGLPNTPMANATVRVVSGNFLTARPVGIVDGVDFMHSGLVRRVDAAGIRRAIDIGALVLLSPFGFSPTGEAFNLTMEDVATSTAVALQADKLLFLTEVPGVRENPRDADSAIDTELSLAEARKLLPACPVRPSPARRPFICSTASGPAKAASSARTSCRSPPTAPCFSRFSPTTASARWWSTKNWKACAKPRPTTSAAYCI
jgi:hypothetical protein